MSFVSELKRRGVLRVTLAYLAGAWLLLQIADLAFPAFGIPDSVMAPELGACGTAIRHLDHDRGSDSIVPLWHRRFPQLVN